MLPILKRIDVRARSFGLATNVPEAIERFRIGENVWRTVPCYMGWISIRIRTNGDVVACGACRESLGNANKASLSEIWNDATYQRLRSTSRSHDAFASVNPSCECGYCSYVLTNARLHSYLRWVPRMATLSKSS